MTQTFDSKVKIVITYATLALLTFLVIYYITLSLNQNTVVTVNFKQSVNNPIEIQYYLTKYQNVPTAITLDGKNTTEYATYKFVIPAKYIYKLDLCFYAEKDEPSLVFVRDINITKIFNKLKLEHIDNTRYIFDTNTVVNLVDNYPFSLFQIRTKLLIINLLITISFIFLLSRQINKLFHSNNILRDRLKVTVFIASIVSIFLMLIFIPHKDRSFLSGKLDQPPTLNLKSLLDTGFMKNTEKYLQSQFIYRETLIEDYYALNRLILKNQFSNKYISTSNQKDIIFTIRTLQKEIVDKNVEQITKINQLLKEKNIPYYFYLAPSKEVFYEEYLQNFVNDETKEIVNYFKTKMPSNIKVNDLYQSLNIYSKEQGFETHFYTDHHWTPDSAYTAYLEILKQLSKDGLVNYNEPTLSKKTYKNTFSGSEARALAYGYRYHQRKDDFNLLYYSGGNYTTTSLVTGTIRYGSFLENMNMYQFQETEKYLNQYGAYSSVTNCQITNNNLDNNKTLVVLGDSYSLPIMFFLTANFENLILLDQRELNENFILNYLNNNEFIGVLNLNYYDTLQDEELFKYFN